MIYRFTCITLEWHYITFAASFYGIRITIHSGLLQCRLIVSKDHISDTGITLFDCSFYSLCVILYNGLLEQRLSLLNTWCLSHLLPIPKGGFLTPGEDTTYRYPSTWNNDITYHCSLRASLRQCTAHVFLCNKCFANVFAKQINVMWSWPIYDTWIYLVECTTRWHHTWFCTLETMQLLQWWMTNFVPHYNFHMHA